MIKNDLIFGEKRVTCLLTKFFLLESLIFQVNVQSHHQTSQYKNESHSTIPHKEFKFTSYMANDDQEKPLAPRTAIQPFPITIDEELSMELKNQRKGFRNCTICFGIITAILLIIAVIMLILAFTVLHVKNPKINMNSVSIMGLDRNNITTSNITVVADVSVKNTNVAAFKFEKTNSSLIYHGTVVGLANIPHGVAKARRTLRLNVTFDVMVAEIIGKQEFQTDLAATGILPFESYTKINGRVKILNIIKRKVTVTLNCSIAVNVTNGAIVDQDCKKRVLI